MWKFSDISGNNSVPIFGSCCSILDNSCYCWFVALLCSAYTCLRCGLGMECGPLPLVGRVDCSSRKQHREDGDRLGPRNIEHFHTLTQLSAQEDFTEFCHCESLKTYISSVSVSRFLNLYLRLQDIVVIFHIKQTQQTT